MEENANLSSSPQLYTTFGDKYSVNGGPGYHAASTTANGGPGYPASILKKRGGGGCGGQDEGQFEARNDEVIRRVVEMKQILQVSPTASVLFTASMADIIEQESDRREGKGRRCCLVDGIDSSPCRTRDIASGRFEEMDE